MPRSKTWTRRQVLQATLAGAAAPLVVRARALGLEGPAPSETVRVGIIGLGGRARDLVANHCPSVPELRIAAVCDCFRPRCDEFVKGLAKGRKWGVYDDFRRMIQREKLDAVMVETTTHARAWIAVQAMQAGLDVYIEKPMCLYVTEGRHMVSAARRYGRVTQVGTQARSMPANRWCSAFIRNGGIGKVHTVLAPNFVGPEKWPGKPGEPLPQGASAHWWDVWTNQAELRDYHRDLHFGWARWRDYDGGGMCFGVTGWGTHAYDQVNCALGTDETGPLEIVLEEPVAKRDSGKFAARKTVGGVVLGDTGDIDTGTGYHHMAKLAGPRGRVTMTFASGAKLKLHLDGDRGPGLGAIFIGEKGKIEINRERLASNPRDIVHSPDNPGPNTKPESSYHLANWIECIKTRKRCNADVECGQRTSTLCELVNIARAVGQVGKPLKWDPVAERFTNCDEANALLGRQRRKGYELPSLA